MAGQNPGSPTDFQYFYEDEVYKINNRGQVIFGLVLENYEANSSDQDSDTETPVQKGEIRVVWHPSGIERVVAEKSVGLADRSLMPGDVVRRLIAGKDTQRGYCRDIEMTAALQIVGTKHVIPNVASERLQPLEEFTPDLAVCLDSWVGTSKGVYSKIRLVSADGSRLEYPDLNTCPLEDYATRRRREATYSSPEFYPGQVVYGPIGSLDNANWLNVTKEMKAARKHKLHDHKFTVESVITERVSVHWQCRAYSKNTEDTAQPQPKLIVEGQDLKRLKLLNVFEPCTLQVGDRNYLTIGSGDVFVTKKLWRKQQSKHFRNLRKQSRVSNKSSKTDASQEHMPSRPKKRASSHRKHKNDNNMDTANETLESLDEELKAVNCPSIKIDLSGDVNLPITDVNGAEEKNDSGISPEPAKEDGTLLNGDRTMEQLNDDDSDNWENTSSDGSDTDSGATWSSRCSSVASGSGRCKRSPQLAVRLLRGKRLKRATRRAPPAPPPRVNDRVVVETLHTTSRANVVWQDGTIEMGIPSTQLYPIHHLDGQECFPGDFVVNGAATVEENQMKHREYGVVQRVDHHGRTAIVRWYLTYTSPENPVPTMLFENEMSVYDLKDHPDFQYRPGTVVIRVANFTGEDATCTAGQVIDNFPSGRVNVWWVDGHTSMCWPQDLYKVGEYDSDEGELWASEGSGSEEEESWETQSSLPEPESRTPDKPADGVENSAGELPTDLANEDSGITLPDTTRKELVPKLLEPRVAAHIERGRVAMRKLEQIFAEHPTLQTQEVMRKLLNLYKECRFLDRLMGTTFFHEDHFLGLIERVKERGANTPRAGERRVYEQLARLFATESQSCDSVADSENCQSEDMFNSAHGKTIVAANVSVEPMEVDVNVSKKPSLHLNLEQACCSESNDQMDCKTVSNKSSTKIDDPEIINRNVCYKLCSLIYAQLVKAHAEVSRRRPALLASFLNNFMIRNVNGEEKLPYHFSVQYGALVISMTDGIEIDAAENNGDAKDSSTTKSDGTAPPETAPLATAEGDIDSDVLGNTEGSAGGEGFSVLESAPANHRFRLSILQPSEPRSFYTAIRREIKLLKSDLPSGVWVRGYEDRIDLLSVMIAGPSRTPYEGGLFVFDVQLGGEYPRAPPLCHYHSYCSDRLNPNLYEDGKVCVSLLGTWSGRGVEVWGKDSSLLQVIVSLQGLILNAEPYFNEAGYEKQKGSQQGTENSRMYNEMVLLKLVQSMTKMAQNPPEPFRDEVLQHLRSTAADLCRRLEGLVALSNQQPTDVSPPDYPLIPASRGFCLTLKSSLETFRNTLRRNEIILDL